MRGIDEDSGEYLSPSRKQNRREALEVLSLADALVALSDNQLGKLPVPETLLPHIADARRITSHIARKRQLAFLAKQMRRESDETLEAIRDAMDAGGSAARMETALLHRAETWRTRLLEGGDAALAELLDAYPDTDRQRLRQLVRNALAERARNKPPAAFRELFRALRGVFAAAAGASDPDIDDEDSPSSQDESDATR
ncbi:MAG: ribosome biogenesis factor YjgA [Luteimonas sp.]